MKELTPVNEPTQIQLGLLWVNRVCVWAVFLFTVGV